MGKIWNDVLDTIAYVNDSGPVADVAPRHGVSLAC